MPLAQERALKNVAKKKGFGKKRTGAFVYGILRKEGWKPEREKKGKHRSEKPSL